MKATSSTLLTSLAVLLAGATLIAAEPKPPAALTKAISTIENDKERLSVEAAVIDIFGSPETRPFFEKSFGCAIFPTIGKGGMGIGGAHGSGWVFKKNALTGTAKMTQITIGFQLGGQAFTQIIFFEDERAYKDFTSGNFELGAQATAVALTAGANASASTAGGGSAGAGNAQARKGYAGGLAIFTKAKGGLMYEASVGGQKFSFRPVK
jgi:lipid-binding SYLF domain-containing protein